MTAARAQGTETFIKHFLGPEPSLDRIADKLKDGELQLSGDLSEFGMLVKSDPAPVGGDGHHTSDHCNALGNPQVKNALLALSLTLFLNGFLPLFAV